MALRTWSSSASTDMNLSTNYSGSGALLTEDDLVFDDTSVVNALATAPLSVQSVTITSGYSGTWSLVNRVLTCALGFSDDGITGTHTYGYGITCNGNSSTFHVGSGVATITATACNLTINGTTGFIIEDNKGVVFSKLILGDSAVVIAAGTATTAMSSTTAPLTFTNNGTLTLNRSMIFNVTGSGSIVSILAGTPTINGTAGQNITFRNNSNTGAVATLPALTISTINTIITNTVYATNKSISLTGNLVCGPLTISSTGTVSDLTFNTGDYSITCGVFTIGATSTGVFTANFGNSAISCTSFAPNSAAAFLNFSTSQFTVTTNWSFGSLQTIDPGEFIVNFVGTGSSSVASAGKSFFDIVVNDAAKAFTFSAGASLHNLTVTAAVSYSHAGVLLTSSGNVSFNNSGTLNLGTGITMNGASSTLYIASTVGTVTASSSVITMNTSTSGVLGVDKAIAVNRLNVTGICSINGLATTTFGGSANPALTLSNNSSLTLDIATIFTVTSSSTMYSLPASYTINGSGIITFRTTGNPTCPELIYTGSGGLNFTSSSSSVMSWNLSGGLNTGTASLTIAKGSTGLNIFNTNNNYIICGALSIRNATLTADFNINLGSSIISCTSFTNSGGAALGTVNLNMGSSQWTCSGSWTSIPTHTLNFIPGNCSVTFTDTASITMNGKFLNFFIINAPTKTITLSDNLICHGYQNIDGTLNKNGKSFSATGDYVEVSNLS